MASGDLFPLILNNTCYQEVASYIAMSMLTVYVCVASNMRLLKLYRLIATRVLFL